MGSEPFFLFTFFGREITFWQLGTQCKLGLEQLGQLNGHSSVFGVKSAQLFDTHLDQGRVRVQYLGDSFLTWNRMGSVSRPVSSNFVRSRGVGWLGSLTDSLCDTHLGQGRVQYLGDSLLTWAQMGLVSGPLSLTLY